MRPLTVNAPIPFGTHRDATTAAAEMRRACALVVGKRNSGKSNGLHVFTAGLARCPDALIWQIDLGGAGLSLPWVKPYAPDWARSPIDWVAPDVDEALTMAAMALDIIDVRRGVYWDLMEAADSDIVPLSHQVPGIYLILDEGARAVGAAGNRELKQALIEIIQLGRFVGVNVVMSGLRGTASVVPTDAMRQIGTRIGMKVTDPDELNYLFGWRHKTNPRDTIHPGCGLWRDDDSGEPPLPFRFYDLTAPSTVRRLARACEPWRPVLDEPSQHEVNPDLRAEYETRWARVGSRLTPRSGPAGSRAHEPAARPTMGRPVSPARGGVDVAQLDNAIARAKRVIAAEQRKASVDVGSEWDRLSRELADDRARGGAGWREPADSGEWEQRALQILRANAAGGVSGLALLRRLGDDGHDVPKSTLYDWLGRTATRISPTRWGPPETRSDL